MISYYCNIFTLFKVLELKHRTVWSLVKKCFWPGWGSKHKI